MQRAVRQKTNQRSYRSELAIIDCCFVIESTDLPDGLLMQPLALTQLHLCYCAGTRQLSSSFSSSSSPSS